MGTPSLKSRMTPRTSFRAVLCVWALVLAVACGPHLGAGLSSWSCTVSTGAPGGEVANAVVGLRVDVDWTAGVSNGGGAGPLPISPWPQVSVAQVSNLAGRLELSSANDSWGGGSGGVMSWELSAADLDGFDVFAGDFGVMISGSLAPNTSLSLDGFAVEVELEALGALVGSGAGGDKSPVESGTLAVMIFAAVVVVCGAVAVYSLWMAERRKLRRQPALTAPASSPPLLVSSSDAGAGPSGVLSSAVPMDDFQSHVNEMEMSDLGGGGVGNPVFAALQEDPNGEPAAV